jgi:hypothetical protein
MLGAVIRSHADLALGFTFWPDDFVAAPDRAQMYEPVPLPYESRGFAQRAPPPGSFVSSGQADSERRPSRAGLQAELEHALLLRARLVLVPVPGRRPDRLSACRLVTGAVSPAGACCLLNRRCGPFRVTSPTAPGIGVGAPRRTPTRLGGRARARLRQGEDPAQPSSPGRGLSPGQSQSSSVAGACHSTLFP